MSQDDPQRTITKAELDEHEKAVALGLTDVWKQMGKLYGEIQELEKTVTKCYDEIRDTYKRQTKTFKMARRNLYFNTASALLGFFAFVFSLIALAVAVFR